MELIARLMHGLTVYFGWFVTPIYYLYSLTSITPLPTIKNPEILLQSATSLAKKIRKKKVTSEEVVRAFINRAQEVNPILNAVVDDRFSAAIEEAKTVDQLIASGQKSEEDLEKETPLLGVPITVKEACAVAGMSHAVGAKLRSGILAEKDGGAVANMRKAGAIPICITNTPELCASIETYNSITGYTPNPYDQHRTAGGSSGGEAALISSGGSVLGIGSDFAGSIRVPCFYTGIFGHKPTTGIVPNKGHCPSSDDKEFQKLLTIGPMARYAEDLNLSLKIMAADKADVLRLDEKVNLKDLKVFFMESKAFSFSEISVDKEIKNSILAASEYFKNAHGCFVQKIQPKEMDDLCEICILQTADVEDIEQVINLKGDKESSPFVELLKLTCNMSDYCANTVMVKAIVNTSLFIPKYKKYKYSALRNNLRQYFKEILGENGVFFFPTFAHPAHYRHQLLWKLSSAGYPMMVNCLGFPATHVPVGLNKNKIPIGFQVIAAPNQDRLCLAVAEELQKVYGGWVPPPMKD